jgi:hypothetical protein
LPKHEQTSKNGGGGRYSAILEFIGEQIKKEKEKERKRKKIEYKEKRKIYICMRKNYEYVKKIIIK